MTGKRTSSFLNNCPIVCALNIIGQKWKIPILWYLADEGTLRCNELKRALHGITNIMLAKFLQEMEGYGLIHREQYNTVSPKVEYSLTVHGQSIVPFLQEFDIWGATADGT